MPPQVVYSDSLPIGIPIPPIPVAEAENALAIGDHNHFHVVVRDVLQDVVKVMAILVGDKDAAGATIDPENRSQAAPTVGYR